MMRLYRLNLRPRSPWRTPWQADTLMGALCSIAARAGGTSFVRERLIDPMLAGRPPFILSDAFPGDLLPIPMALRLVDPCPPFDRKTIKRARWIRRADFLALRAAGPAPAVPWDRALPDSAVYHHEIRRHNTLARDSDASLEDGGLFSRPDFMLRRWLPGNGHDGADSALNGADHLTLYFRALDERAIGLFVDLLHELSLTGFGADVATGRGQFDIIGDPQLDAELDRPPLDANAVVILSTFQPAPGDPADGQWEVFPKFGKLGPGLGVANIHKHTLIMFRPGACSHIQPVRPYLGRGLPMDLILPADAVASLRERGIEVVHPAFGLAVPAVLSRSPES